MKRTTYFNFVLLDGTKDMQPTTDMFLTVEGDTIVYLGKQRPQDGDFVDLQGRYLIPGLTNLHVHLPASGKPSTKPQDKSKLVKFVLSTALTREIGVALGKKSAQQQLYSGVTTLRAVGGVGHLDTVLRDRINMGKIAGPRILACDYAIGPEHGHMVGTVAVAVHNEQEAIACIDDLVAHKVDCIKLMITGGVLDAEKRGEPGVLKMPAELVKACCDYAHSCGLKVAAHVESSQGVHVALQNGVDTVEHGSKLDENDLQLLKQNGGAFVCTLSPAVPLANLKLDVSNVTELAQYNTLCVLDGCIAGTKQALENGIPVGLGTDTGCPYVTQYDTWRELAYFVKHCNVTPTFALHTATLVNAQIAGVGDVTGSIEQGKCADFVVTNGNPLEDFSVIRTPYLVCARGKTYIKKVKINSVCEKALAMLM